MINKRFYTYIAKEAKNQKKILSKLYLCFLDPRDYPDEPKHSFDASELIKLDSINFAVAMAFISQKKHAIGRDDMIMRAHLDELNKFANHEIIEGI